MIPSVFMREDNKVTLYWNHREDVSHYNVYASSSASFSPVLQLNINPISNAPLPSASSGKIPNPKWNTLAGKIVYEFNPTTVGLNDKEAFYVKLETILASTGSPEEPLANVPAIIIYPKGVYPPTEGERLDKNVHLFGWDYDNNVWRKIAVDSQGRLIISP